MSFEKLMGIEFLWGFFIWSGVIMYNMDSYPRVNRIGLCMIKVCGLVLMVTIFGLGAYLVTK